MVFTCSMPTNARAPRSGVSRRSLLAAFGAGGVAIVIAGCGSPAPPAKTADAVAASNPLGPLYTETLALISQYDQAIAGNATITGLLGPLREETRQHAIAIAALMGAATPPIAAGPSPSGVPVPTGSAGVPVHPAATSPPASSAPPPVPTPTSDATRLPTTEPTASPTTGASGLPTGLASGLPSGLPSAPPSMVPAGNPIAAKAVLATAEKTAQANAVSACLTAPADQVAVLASIAACRATHVVVLA